MKLSIIIPVYNEAGTIIATLEKVKRVVIPDATKEIIVVDDGSDDGTNKLLDRYVGKNNTVRLVHHRVNQGKGAAVMTGIARANGTHIVIQDADNEYDPKYLPDLIRPILSKRKAVVYGTRLDRMPHIFREEKRILFLLHYLGNRALSFITSVLYGTWITDMETCYKLFPKKALNGLTIHAKGFEFEPEVTAKLLRRGYAICEVPITTIPRGPEEGKKLNTIRDGLRALITLIRYRFGPLT